MNEYDVPRGTTLFAGQQALVYITNFGFYLALARTLSLAEIGEISLLLAFLALFTTASQIALPLAATRFISASVSNSDYPTARVVAKTTMRLLVILAVILLSTVALLLPWASKLLPGLPAYFLILEVSFAGFF